MKDKGIDTCWGHIENIDITIKEIKESINKRSDYQDDFVKKVIKNSMSLNVANIYNGLENIFEIILKDKGIKIVKDKSWHKKILKTFQKENIFGEDIIKKLDEYLKFRHVVRHKYSIELNEDEVLRMSEEIITVYPLLKEKIINYISQKKGRFTTELEDIKNTEPDKKDNQGPQY